MLISQNKLLKFGICVMTLAVFSCGKKKEDDPVEPIVGTWKLDCYKTSDTSYVTTTIAYDAAGTATGTSVSYSASGCADADKSTTSAYSVTWTKGAAVTGVDGAYKMDITYVTFDLTFHTDTLVNIFNTAGTCGGGWVKGTAKSLKADTANCDFTKIGDKAYDIYKVDGTKYYDGKNTDDLDGSTDAKRPTALDTDYSYTKQ